MNWAFCSGLIRWAVSTAAVFEHATWRVGHIFSGVGAESSCRPCPTHVQQPFAVSVLSSIQVNTTLVLVFRFIATVLHKKLAIKTLLLITDKIPTTLR